MDFRKGLLHFLPHLKILNVETRNWKKIYIDNNYLEHFYFCSQCYKVLDRHIFFITKVQARDKI